MPDLGLPVFQVVSPDAADYEGGAEDGEEGGDGGEGGEGDEGDVGARRKR